MHAAQCYFVLPHPTRRSLQYICYGTERMQEEIARPSDSTVPRSRLLPFGTVNCRYATRSHTVFARTVLSRVPGTGPLRTIDHPIAYIHNLGPRGAIELSCATVVFVSYFYLAHPYMTRAAPGRAVDPDVELCTHRSRALRMWHRW
jgi:hypothetical protein